MNTATPETIRFENSTNEWKPFFGTNEPALHPGQSRQPRPESVRRTDAPLATITNSHNTFASAARLNVRGEIVSPRRRGSEVSTAVTVAVVSPQATAHRRTKKERRPEGPPLTGRGTSSTCLIMLRVRADDPCVVI
jgi:hypothetical protein